MEPLQGSYGVAMITQGRRASGYCCDARQPWAVLYDPFGVIAVAVDSSGCVCVVVHC